MLATLDMAGNSYWSGEGEGEASEADSGLRPGAVVWLGLSADTKSVSLTQFQVGIRFHDGGPVRRLNQIKIGFTAPCGRSPLAPCMLRVLFLV